MCWCLRFGISSKAVWTNPRQNRCTHEPLQNWWLELMIHFPFWVGPWSIYYFFLSFCRCMVRVYWVYHVPSFYEHTSSRFPGLCGGMFRSFSGLWNLEMSRKFQEVPCSEYRRARQVAVLVEGFPSPENSNERYIVPGTGRMTWRYKVV